MTPWCEADSDLKLWAWAYREHVRHLDLHDANWIDRAAGGWTEIAELRSLLRTHGLLHDTRRSKFFGLHSHVVLFRDTCVAAFHTELPATSTFMVAQRRWMDVVRLVAGKTGVRPSLLAPAAMKVYWFSQPGVLPMYDSGALKGLRISMKRYGGMSNTQRIRPENFFESMARFIELGAKTRLIDAIQFCDRRSPYLLCVASVYLQLIGAGRSREILSRVDRGVWRAPFAA